MAEKTEQATPKKLRDARKKGQVAKSQDFSSAFTFIVSIAVTLFLSSYLYNQLAAYLVSTFKSASDVSNLQERIPSIMVQAITVICNTSFPIAILTTMTGVFVSFIIVGPLFSFEAMKPDLKKLNPINNIKNLFKFKTIFELIKSILKIIGALILIYTVVWSSIPEIVATAALSVYGTALVFNDFLVKIIIRVGIFFLLIAIADLIYQKRNFAKEMRMEKYEVKQEFKDTEGDPHIKGKRRQVAQEIAYQEGPAAVKRSRAVITNPIHIAVGLSYSEKTEPAPRILVMGKGVTADQIVKLAVEYNIPIMRNVALAQTLFEKGELYQYIPEETYEAVAEILRWLEGLEQYETAGSELFTQ
ncbi:MAG: EscU/YscU/HrcU family type III secretion system export apparatus switch protein [Chlamydiae bacterium]|nr:EscU/YscU/HrcU family type III secretion system export apparatus switch protein [Chlamydiota bacterium]